MSNFCPPPTHSISISLTDGKILAVYHLIEDYLMYSVPVHEIIATPKKEVQVIMFNNMGMLLEEAQAGQYINRINMKSRNPAEWFLVNGEKV